MIPAAHTIDRPDGVLYHGMYPATVTTLDDPERRGRIEVQFDWLSTTDGDRPPQAWAKLVTPYADADQGFQMVPEIGSTVVVAFQAGHLSHPYVIGAVWNGNASPPEAFTDANDKRLIRTRSGSLLEFDDTDGSVKITIETPGGNRVVLDDGGTKIQITSSAGARIELTPAGGVTIEAASTVDVRASMVTVDAPMSRFTGIVQCDTLIASTGVVSPSYTPGAGNVW